MISTPPFPISVSNEVRDALAEGRGVVALETTIVVHGLPRPINLEVAAACEDAVRAAGAVPATIGVLGGRAIIGMSRSEVETLAEPTRECAKLSARDLGLAIATRSDGATTVAGTIALAALAGVRVMATGGLGGVHRDAVHSFDESADLGCLARTPVLVVASGVKSILDIPATLERLDSLGVPVVGYRTNAFPGFYRSDSGSPVDWRLDDAAVAARAFDAHVGSGGRGFLLANPVAEEAQLDALLHEDALAAALAAVVEQKVSGKGVTPVMLSAFAARTAGVSVDVNKTLVVGNARVAGDVAAELAALGQ